jgi:hypothetical protein
VAYLFIEAGYEPLRRWGSKTGVLFHRLNPNPAGVPRLLPSFYRKRGT